MTGVEIYNRSVVPHDISFEDFKRFLENGSLDISPGGVASTLVRVEEEHQEEAIRLTLEWLVQRWRSDGAWDALRFMPPLLIRSHETDPTRFTDLLFPPIVNARRPNQSRPKNFWEWQIDYAKPLPAALIPQRDVAREKWIDRCRKSSELQRQLRSLARSYIQFVRIAANDPYFWRYDDGRNFRRYYARRAEPDCGHVEIHLKCDRCPETSLEAWEAHYGWQFPRNFGAARNIGAKSGPSDSPTCTCCQRNHDYTPTGQVRCTLCAEAVFYAKSEITARRWGGWPWLVEEIQYAALSLGLSNRPELRELAEGLLLAPRLSTPDEEASSKRPSKSRPDPWQRSFGLSRGVGTFLIPVTMSTTDLKSDVQENVVAIFDLLWRRLRLRNPKSTGRSAVRGDQWERYTEWLWLYRVDGKPVDEIALGFDSPVAANLPVTSRTIRDGMRVALRALSAS